MSGSDTRKRILRAGADLIYKKGYASTSLGDILAASGVPKGSFYHHYQSKEAFGLEAVDFHLGFLVSWLQEALSPDSRLGPIERLRRFFEEYREFLKRRKYADGCPVGNLAQESGALPEGFREKIRAAFLLMREPVEACLTEARRAGELQAGLDPAETADFILNAWEGALLRMKVEGDDGPLRAFERMVFERLLKK
jgi:TetR/AcrR family transcriptional repressor of nem operon